MPTPGSLLSKMPWCSKFSLLSLVQFLFHTRFLSKVNEFDRSLGGLDFSRQVGEENSDAIIIALKNQAMSKTQVRSMSLSPCPCLLKTLLDT